MLLDTSGLLCYFDRRDPRHEEAGLLFDTSPALLTHSYILAEFIPLCHSRRLDSGEAIGFSLRLLGNRGIEVVWVDDDLHRAALSLLQARPDKDYSLCDAVSFVLMRARGLHDALTTDHHFEQEGFLRLLER
jgi:uncharacterized protein